MTPVSALPANIFELDANTVDPAGGGDDWDTLFAGGPNGADAFSGIIEDPLGQTIFVQGESTKDDVDTTTWQHKSGSVPDKDELTNAYSAAYLVPDGIDPGTDEDLVLYFGADRFAVNGSANLGFWFYESDFGPDPIVPPATEGTFHGDPHTVGDVLVLTEFTNGGAVPNIQVWEWDPDNPAPTTCPSNISGSTPVPCQDNDGNLKLISTSATADCDVTPLDAPACANVNGSPITVPWPYDAKGGGNQQGKVPTGGFFEGGVNISQLFGGDRPCISSFLAETRSSPSIDSTLKDFVSGKLPLCGADISIGPDDVNDVGDPHTFTVHVSKTFAGSSSPVAGNFPTVTLTDDNGQPVVPTTDECATVGTDANGDCDVTFSSSTAGVITGHAESTVVLDGVNFEVSTGPAQGQNPDATKVYVDGRVSIAPDATNGIGESHTFTVTATQQIGAASSFTAATDGHVDVVLTDSNGAINQIDTAASSCDDPGDNLNASGQCTITFKSDVAGTVTGHATVSINLSTSEGPITITRETDDANGNSDDAVKVFVDGTITWLKHDDLGNLLGGAVFTVCKIEAWNSDTASYVDIPDDCFDVADDVLVDDPDATTPDADDAAGKFKLEHLTLGKYTIQEKTAPEGYALDPDKVTVEINTTTTTADAGIFVDPALFKVIIYTCNTSTEKLVVSEVDEDPGSAGGVKDTQAAGSLTDEQQAFLCGLDANYDNKTRGTHSYDVTIPKP